MSLSSLTSIQKSILSYTGGNGSRNRQELRNHFDIPQSMSEVTFNRALTSLKEAGYLTSRPDIHDMRKVIYRVTVLYHLEAALIE